MKEKVYDWGTDEGRKDAEMKTPGQIVDQFVNKRSLTLVTPQRDQE